MKKKTAAKTSKATPKQPKASAAKEKKLPLKLDEELLKEVSGGGPDPRWASAQ